MWKGVLVVFLCPCKQMLRTKHENQKLSVKNSKTNDYHSVTAFYIQGNAHHIFVTTCNHQTLRQIPLLSIYHSSLPLNMRPWRMNLVLQLGWSQEFHKPKSFLFFCSFIMTGSYTQARQTPLLSFIMLQFPVFDIGSSNCVTPQISRSCIALSCLRTTPVTVTLPQKCSGLKFFFKTIQMQTNYLHVYIMLFQNLNKISAISLTILLFLGEGDDMYACFLLRREIGFRVSKFS